MPGLKEIRRRLTSIKNTRQITRAMKLVSAAKLKRAEEAAISGRKFNEGLETAVCAVLSGLPAEYSHPLLSVVAGSENAPRRIIAFSAERGLCGAYNSNIQKALVAHSAEAESDLNYTLFGRRISAFALRSHWPIVSTHEGLPDDITKWPFTQVVGDFVRDFIEGKISGVTIYYTKFLSGVNQIVTSEDLLPFSLERIQQALTARNEDTSAFKEGQFKYSPRADEILEYLIPLYLRSKMRGAALQSKASEHASRMAAMDSATNNADDLMNKLRLYYNRARQSTITRELIDIIGGAQALE